MNKLILTIVGGLLCTSVYATLPLTAHFTNNLAITLQVKGKCPDESPQVTQLAPNSPITMTVPEPTACTMMVCQDSYPAATTCTGGQELIRFGANSDGWMEPTVINPAKCKATRSDNNHTLTITFDNYWKR